MKNDTGVTVTLKIQDGIKSFEIPFDVPPGIDPRAAVAAVHQTLEELHELAPLHPMQLKTQVAMGLFGDAIPISKVKAMLLEAPPKAEWGIQIVEPPRVLANPAYRKGQQSPFIKARARLSECENINEVISTLTCYALLTSRSARGLAALHGYAPKIVPPQMPERPVQPNGVHERKLKLVAPEVPETKTEEPEDGGGAA